MFIRTLLRRLKNAPRRLTPRFRGAYPNVATAIASLPAHCQQGYNDPNVAEVSFDKMCTVAPWDYPVLFWLQSLTREHLSVLDAGGHMGTKYIAFRDHLDLDNFRWTVLDLPEIIAAAKAKQTTGDLPQAIDFTDDIQNSGQTDLLLASGLLQYLDQPFAGFLSTMPSQPKYIILNKVALRNGPNVVTLEKIGPNRVPYQIRCQNAFEIELDQAGYTIVDHWQIPEIAHTIPLHPRLGKSQSFGYFLRLK